ncbi:MAG: CRISPR-associated ring nuclease [Chloroflexota bacterium]
MSISNRSSVIATVGKEPQVVSLAVMKLLENDVNVNAVRVIHTDKNNPPLELSLTRLRETFKQFPQITYSEVEIKSNGRPLQDMESEENSRAALLTIYREVLKAKQKNETVHLCAAGGRKVMSIYSMTAAQLLFEAEDRLWYLFSSEQLHIDKKMIPDQNDSVELVNVPVIRWSGIPPALTEIGRFLNPHEAITTINSRQEAAYQAKLYTFLYSELTSAEREAIEIAATYSDWSYKQIGRHLNKSHRTIDAQIQSIYEKARVYFAVKDLTRATLSRLFKDYNWGNNKQQA